jgi:hypothetical protein
MSLEGLDQAGCLQLPQARHADAHRRRITGERHGMDASAVEREVRPRPHVGE